MPFCFSQIGVWVGFFFFPLQEAGIELHCVWNFCVTACHDTELGWLCGVATGHGLSGLAEKENSTMLPLCGKSVVKQTPLQSCTAAFSTGALWLGSSDGSPAIEPCSKDKRCKWGRDTWWEKKKVNIEVSVLSLDLQLRNIVQFAQ